MEKQQIEQIKAQNPIVDVARELGIQVRRDNSAKCFRPEKHKHGDKNPSLSFDTKINRFKCFVCGDVRGDVIEYVMQVKGWDFNQATEYLARRVGISIEQPAYKSSNGNYLKSRGLNEAIIKKYQLKQEGNLVKIPYFNKEGKILFHKVRKIIVRDGEKRFFYDRKGVEVQIYNNWHLPKCNDYVILCAGELDTLSLLQSGYKAVGLPGEGLFQDEWVRLFQHIGMVYILLDGDKVGWRESIKIAKKFGDSALIVPMVDGKDANDLLREGYAKSDFGRLIAESKTVEEIEKEKPCVEVTEAAKEDNLITPTLDLDKVIPANGWIRNYYDLLAPSTDAPKMFHLLTGLCILAGAVGNRVWIADVVRKLYLNLFCVLLSPSGSGRKSTVVAPARVLLTDPTLFDKNFLLPEDFSVEALGREFVNCPERVLVSNEFKASLDTFKRGYNQEGLSKLVNLFDFAYWDISRVGEKKQKVEDISLSIIGASTTEWLLSALEPKGYQAGLWVRFLFCLAERTDFKPEPDYVRDELLSLGGDLANIRANIDQDTQADFSQVQKEVEAFALEAEALRKELGKDPKGALLSGGAERLSLYAKKISALYALSESGAPKPNKEHYLIACELLRFLFGYHRYIVEMELCFSGIERKRKELLKVIIEFPGITKSEITRKTQSLDSRTRDQLLLELEEGKWIRSEERNEGRYITTCYYPYSHR